MLTLAMVPDRKWPRQGLLNHYLIYYPEIRLIQFLDISFLQCMMHMVTARTVLYRWNKTTPMAGKLSGLVCMWPRPGLACSCDYCWTCDLPYTTAVFSCLLRCIRILLLQDYSGCGGLSSERYYCCSTSRSKYRRFRRNMSGCETQYSLEKCRFKLKDVEIRLLQL